MKRIVFVAYEVDYLDEVDQYSNSEIMSGYNTGAWDLVEDMLMSDKREVVAVTYEGEKADADQAGTTYRTPEFDGFPD